MHPVGPLCCSSTPCSRCVCKLCAGSAGEAEISLGEQKLLVLTLLELCIYGVGFHECTVSIDSRRRSAAICFWRSAESHRGKFKLIPLIPGCGHNHFFVSCWFCCVKRRHCWLGRKNWVTNREQSRSGKPSTDPMLLSLSPHFPLTGAHAALGARAAPLPACSDVLSLHRWGQARGGCSGLAASSERTSPGVPRDGGFVSLRVGSASSGQTWLTGCSGPALPCCPYTGGLSKSMQIL